jgi:VWFA-related protein
MRSTSSIRTLAVVAATLAAIAAGAPLGAQRGGGGGGGFGGGGIGGGRGGGGQVGGGRGATPQQPQDRRQNQDDTPTFRSKVTVVQIDAIVTDASGNPVSGLTQDDFDVLEAGKHREISTFAAVDIPLPVPDPPGATRLESDLATNGLPPGRTYLIALDEVDPPNAMKARHFLRDFVEKYMGPTDLVAVSLTGRGLASSAQDFTSNKRLILAAIDKFSGGFAPFEAGGSKSTSEGGAATNARVSTSDARQLGSSLRRLTEFLATMPGRKVMLYVGEGIGGLDPYAATAYKGTSLTPGERDFHEAIAAATRGNVTIYPIDPRGLTTDTTEAESFDTSELDARADLAGVADVTGGFALTGSNNTSKAFTRLVRENSTYYTIGFSSEYDRRDGRFVPVQVTVKRPGLQVRARSGYVAPLEREAARPTVDSDAKIPTVLSALANPVAVNDVIMRAVASPYKGMGNNALVALSIEFDVSKLDLVEKNGLLTSDVEVSFVATDTKGKVKPGRRYDTTVAMKKEAAENALRTGIRVVSDIALPQGRYQLRIAAGSRSRAGSVVYDLEVPDFGDGLQISGVSLTTASAPALSTFRATDPLGKALPGPPIALRDFAHQDAIAVYAEAYGGKGRTQLPAMSAELRTPDGQVIGKLLEQKQSSSLHDDPGAIGLSARLPLSGLQPGVYVIRVVATADNGKDAVQRDVPIRVW